jgi:hypothetical protein
LLKDTQVVAGEPGCPTSQSELVLLPLAFKSFCFIRVAYSQSMGKSTIIFVNVVEFTVLTTRCPPNL